MVGMWLVCGRYVVGREGDVVGKNLRVVCGRYTCSLVPSESSVV